MFDSHKHFKGVNIAKEYLEKRKNLPLPPEDLPSVV